MDHTLSTTALGSNTILLCLGQLASPSWATHFISSVQTNAQVSLNVLSVYLYRVWRSLLVNETSVLNPAYLSVPPLALPKLEEAVEVMRIDGFSKRGTYKEKSRKLRVESLRKRTEKRGDNIERKEGSTQGCWTKENISRSTGCPNIPQTPPHITSLLCDLTLWISREVHFGLDCILDFIPFRMVLCFQMGCEMAHKFMIKEASIFNELKVKKATKTTKPEICISCSEYRNELWSFWKFFAYKSFPPAMLYAPREP